MFILYDLMVTSPDILYDLMVTSPDMLPHQIIARVGSGFRTAFDTIAASLDLIEQKLYLEIEVCVWAHNARLHQLDNG